MDTTVFLLFRSFAVQIKYLKPVIVSGLVTLISAYHYGRVFNSWVDAYDYPTGSTKLTGVPFNDVYRYIEWLLNMVLLLVEFFLMMKLNDDGFNSKSWPLGLAAALLDLLICIYVFLCYIVYELLVGLAAATAQEKDLEIRGKIQTAQVMTVINWYTHSVVYLFPMFGTNAAPSLHSHCRRHDMPRRLLRGRRARRNAI